jgi:hypothetical protein
MSMTSTTDIGNGTGTRFKLALAGVLAAMAALVTGMTIAPAASAGISTANLNAVPVQGTIQSTGGTFDGVLDIDRLTLQNGQLMARGTLTGTASNAAGDTVGSVTDQPIATPVADNGTGSCQILDLSLGTLHLNVLGLVVHLDPVHLNIAAQPGAGNLLGNLLCMVVHLLDGSSPAFAQPIVNLLNQVIARV